MTRARCSYVYPEGARCSSNPDEHVHQKLPCTNGKPDRHHEFAPEPPHVHVFNRCACGVQAAA